MILVVYEHVWQLVRLFSSHPSPDKTRGVHLILRHGNFIFYAIFIENILCCLKLIIQLIA